MKKVIAFIMAIAMVFSMVTIASAAENTTTLTTTVPAATYTLNIPADQEVPFGTTHSSIGNISISDAKGFAIGKNLEVTVTYSGAFTSENASTKIPYTLSLYAKAGSTEGGYNYFSKNQELPSGASILFAGLRTGAVNNKIEIETTLVSTSHPTTVPVDYIGFNANSDDWGKALAGEYTSTITFTAQVVVEE